MRDRTGESYFFDALFQSMCRARDAGDAEQVRVLHARIGPHSMSGCPVCQDARK